MYLNAAIWAFGGKFGLICCQLIIMMIFARLISPTSFGVVVASQVVHGISISMVKFGIGAALIQMDNLTKPVASTALSLMILTSLFQIILLSVSVSWLSDILNVIELLEIMPIIMLSILITALSSPSQNLLMREMRFKLLSASNITAYIVAYFFVGIPLAVYGFEYWAPLISGFIQAAIMAAVLFYKKPVWPTLNIQPTYLQQLFNFGGGVFLGQLASEVAKRIDNLIIAITLGPTALGYYSRAYSIMDLANTLFGSVFRDVLFSGFSKQRRRNANTSHNKQENVFVISYAFLSFLIFPISFLLFLLSDHIVLVLLGDNWESAVPVLQLLSFGIFLRIGYKISHAFNLAEGKAYMTAAVSALFAFLVGCGAYGGSAFGIEGVALGVLFAQLVQFASLACFALRRLKIGWLGLARAIMPFLIAAGWPLPALIILRDQLRECGWSAIIIIISLSLIYAFLYFASLFMFRRDSSVFIIYKIGKKKIEKSMSRG